MSVCQVELFDFSPLHQQKDRDKLSTSYDNEGQSKRQRNARKIYTFFTF